MRYFPSWSICGVAVMGLIVGLASMRLRTPANVSSQLSIEPADLVVREDTVQGQPILVDYQLTNRGTQPMRVTRISASCGCMAVGGKEGEVLRLPFTLEQNSSAPVRLTIDTEARVGRQRLEMTVSYSTGDENHGDVTARIKANVLVALRAEPPVVILPEMAAGQSVVRTIELGDMLSGSGVEIASVSSSRPDVVSATLRPAEGTTSMFGDSVTGRRRYYLDVTIRPQHLIGRVQESLLLMPKSGAYTPLWIPIFYKAATPDVVLSPPTLTLAFSKESKSFERTLTVRGDEGMLKSLRLLNAPVGSKIDIELRNKVAWLMCRIRAPDADAESNEEIVLASTSGHTIRIPLRFLPQKQ